MTQTPIKPQNIDKKETFKNLRYEFYHELDQLYHCFFDKIATSDIRDGDAANLTQNILKARQESLKYLVSDEEMDKYEKRFEDN